MTGCGCIKMERGNGNGLPFLLLFLFELSTEYFEGQMVHILYGQIAKWADKTAAEKCV